jgi:glycosyltransferase involved in cell wall biosynthesis
VNDGSHTGIENVCIEKIKSAVPLFQFVAYPQNRGKGFALREGMKNSTAEIVMYTDIDFPYTTESFLQVFDALYQNSCDIAAGAKDTNYYSQTPAVRKLISKLLRFFSKMFLGLKITDTQCGLKGMNEKGKALFFHTSINRYLFDLEFIFLASRNKKLKVSPVEIHLRNNVQFSPTPYNILFTEAGNFLKIFLRSIFTGRE